MPTPRIRHLWLVLILLYAAGCAGAFRPPDTHRRVEPAEFERRFTREELAGDLDFMTGVIERVHPNAYAATPRERIEALKQRLLDEVREPITRVRFYPLVARLASAYEDGHTYAVPPHEEWSHFLEGGGLTIPVAVEHDGERIVLTARLDGASTPPGPGDRLLSVNGATDASLYATYLSEKSGNRAFKTAGFGRDFHLQLWLQGVAAPYRLGYRAAEAAMDSVAELQGMTLEQISRRRKDRPEGQDGGAPAYRFEMLPDGIGCIDFRQMNDRTAFDAFLRETFTELRERQARGLIVDLRRNGGGDSGLGQALLEHVTDKPFTMADRKEWKVSREYREYLKCFAPPALRWLPLEWFHPFGRQYWGTPVGESVVSRNTAERPPPNRLRFAGPTCFLIGPRTFSSAMMLANAVGDFKLATLIGQETGGVPNAFGEVYSFDLPGTRLQVGVSSALFVRANGDASDRRGVLPDIEVKQNPDDMRRGVDTVLERAKAWCREQANAANEVAAVGGALSSLRNYAPPSVVRTTR